MDRDDFRSMTADMEVLRTALMLIAREMRAAAGVDMPALLRQMAGAHVSAVRSGRTIDAEFRRQYISRLHEFADEIESSRT